MADRDELVRLADYCNRQDVNDVDDTIKLLQACASAMREAASALSARRVSEDELPFIVEYRRKPEPQYRGFGSEWTAMAAFDYEGPAEAYAKSCAQGDIPWEYQVRPRLAARAAEKMRRKSA